MTKCLWIEDECTRGLPGHEYVGEAWQRLFGTVYSEQKRTAFIDHGDCLEWQYGDVSVWCVYGAWYEIKQRHDSCDGPELIAPAVATVLDRVWRESASE